jgi:hypothetical protein
MRDEDLPKLWILRLSTFIYPGEPMEVSRSVLGFPWRVPMEGGHSHTGDRRI